MICLIDTNVLARYAQPTHVQHESAVRAVTTLRQQDHQLVITPQNLYEFWVVATRPKSANGMDMTADEARQELAVFKALFPVLPDTETIYHQWERLVHLHSVLGKNAHDARLVAAMLVHGVTHLL